MDTDKKPEDTQLTPGEKTAGAQATGVEQESVPHRVKVFLSQDKMKAEVELSLDPLEGEAPLEMGDILEVLDEEGVTFGIDEAEIVRALAEASEAQATRCRMIAATGQPARAGTGSRIELQSLLEDHSKPRVYPGDLLATLKPALSPEPGRTVTDEALDPPEATAPDEKLIPGPGVHLDDQGSALRVAEGVVGYATFFEGKVSVEDLLQVSDDHLTVTLVLYPPSSSGKKIGMEEILELIEQRGITHGIDRDALQQALRSESPDEDALRTVIARGRNPGDGRDAEIEYHFNTRVSPGRVEGQSERIDFKERNVLQNVEAGDLLAEISPALQGKDGFNVFGEALAGCTGRDRSLDVMGSVEVSDDGLRFTASDNGVVVLGNPGKLGVFDEHTVQGDVDYTTGNLDMDGVLEIKGWVRTGFKVKAAGDLVVEGGIEEAEVQAGTHLSVRGGIVGGKSGHVESGGDLEAGFIENARVSVVGDASVASLMQSLVVVNGHLDATQGKGCIIGGYTLAEKGLEANELGSRGGVRTPVVVGISRSLLKRLARAKKALNDLKRCRIKFQLEKTGPNQSRSNRLTKLRREIALRTLQLDRDRKRCARAATEESGDDPGFVQVNKTLHGGTTINIKGFSRCFKETVERGGRFVLDTNDWNVKLME